MRRLFSRIAGKTGRILLSISKKIAGTSHSALEAQAEIVAAWFRDEGDKTLRVNYDLSQDSVVFDLGGYEGQWTSDIFARYCCLIHVFEPVQDYAKQIEKRFAKNRRIVVHHCGLASESCKVKIAMDRDGSSTFKTGATTTEGILVKAIDFLRDNEISKIDLIKINIEGGEYELLEHLIDTKFVGNIKNIQVQFHNFVPNAEQRMLRIQKDLEKTHTLTYQYRFVWENWRIKSPV
jgi:FkbM family methyltransferase